MFKHLKKEALNLFVSKYKDKCKDHNIRYCNGYYICSITGADLKYYTDITDSIRRKFIDEFKTDIQEYHSLFNEYPKIEWNMDIHWEEFKYSNFVNFDKENGLTYNKDSIEISLKILGNLNTCTPYTWREPIFMEDKIEFIGTDGSCHRLILDNKGWCCIYWNNVKSSYHKSPVTALAELMDIFDH